MIEPHSAQLGASAWAAKATFPPPPSDDPPSEPVKSASVRLALLFPLVWPLASPLVATTVSSSLATDTGAAVTAAGTADALGASSAFAGSSATTGVAAGFTTASDWAVMPSFDCGASADAPENATGASATIAERSISPRDALSSSLRNRLPSQRKM